jgi:hypothetical protein
MRMLTGQCATAHPANEGEERLGMPLSLINSPFGTISHIRREIDVRRAHNNRSGHKTVEQDTATLDSG